MTATGSAAANLPASTQMRPPLGWADRWAALRDRLLASPGFRRWAVAFPMTRPIARRRTRALFDLCGGFVYSQILFACVELNLFDLLADGPQTVPDLASRLSLPPDGAARLLAAAASLKLVSRRSGDRFGLGPLGAAMVDNEAVAAMVRHHAILYGDLRDPVALLRGKPAETELSRYWAYARSTHPGRLQSDRIDEYTTLMAASQGMIAEEVLDAYPIARHRRLLDIGGGDGTFLMAAAKRAPRLSLILFDLPPVAERARARFAAMGISGRMNAVGGDFLSGQLPRGADLISLVRVLHDHDDDDALTLLTVIRQALPADGALLIAEPMSGTPGSEPAGDAYFGFYLLAMRSGRPRTQDEIATLLRKAGFTRSRAVPTKNPILVRLILARP
jgi:demethylspheroidene O-methyltransferase